MSLLQKDYHANNLVYTAKCSQCLLLYLKMFSLFAIIFVSHKASFYYAVRQAFACQSETFRFLYALLIPTKSSKPKNQVVHEQKFKDPLNIKCLFSLVG